MNKIMTAINANVLLDVPGVGLKATPLTLHIDTDPYESRHAFRHRILALIEEYYLDYGKVSSLVLEELGEGGRYRVAVARHWGKVRSMVWPKDAEDKIHFKLGGAVVRLCDLAIH